jgi:hypothetical protein
MGWPRKVWDGPFKTPPLAQPITVGWVLLKVFETIWRLSLVLCVVIALFAIGIWYSERNPLASQIAVNLGQSSDECRAKGFPIHADIENKSSKMIGEVDIQLRVYPQGSSKDVVSYSGSHHELHNIMRPGQALGWCFPMPELEPGSTGPFTVAADVTYASELPKNIPVTAAPPPIETTVSPPPLVRMSQGPQPPTTHRRIGPKTIWQSASDLVGVVILFLLAASSGYALIGLFDRAFKTRMQAKLADDSADQGGCLAIPFIGFLNMGIVGTGGSYVLGLLGWDAWITRFDDWSWAHGLADGGMLLLAGLASQWPWLLFIATPARADSEKVRSA